MFALYLCAIHATPAQSKLVDSKYNSIISEYLNVNKRTSKNISTDFDDLYVTKELFSEKTGITNVYLSQRYKGVKIYNSISSVGIKNNKVFYFADKFETSISGNINTEKPSITPIQAINNLMNHLSLGYIGNLKELERRENKTVFSKGNASPENISVEKVYFKDIDGTLKLAWDLNILTLDGKHWWSARVDAITGEILDLNDWILTCNFSNSNHLKHNHISNGENKSFSLLKTTNSNAMLDGSGYRVFALPTESPNHGPRTLVLEPADAIASPFGWHDDDGVLGSDYTTTQGNNVITQDDTDGNNSGGIKADGGVNLNFDFSLDLEEQPSASLDASLTNLFYINNVVHDITHYYGFDEDSGNFQESHYTTASAAGSGDPVIADGLDGSGINNANFGTPRDGFSPRMQMFLWESSTGDALTINGSSLAGGYVGIPAGFGGALSEIPLTADLVLSLDDDSGSSTDPYDACDTNINGGSLAGKIAIINRGTCEFGDKLLAVQNAGALAAIVITDERPIGVMGGGVNGDSVTIPSIMINRADGDAIIAALNNTEIINGSLMLPPRIDGNFDNGVIIHEYGHGISNRLTGGANDADCLVACTERDEDGDCITATNTEQMGEGWSDWFALMLTMKASDVGTTGRGIATFDTEQPTDGPGIRPFRYSIDTSINPLTYGDTNNTASISAPHGVGSVWCTMLWDLTWAYIDKYGFDTNFYNGSGGNNRVMQVIMDGMKLQVCQPGFVDGRDAILAADIALTGGENQCLIWEVFAARGLGVNANQGSTLLRTDQVEDFTLPDSNNPSLVNCSTLSSTNFDSNDYKVYPNPASTTLTIRASRNMGDVVIDLMDINGRKVYSKSTTLSGEIHINTRDFQSGLYILRIKGEYINTNEKIIIK